MILKKLLTGIVFLSTLSYANSCPKWLPLANGDIVVVISIYDKSITEPDLDCDGIIDKIDTDLDGDGVLNTSDAFPANSSESIDTDGDGQGNNADLDDDNDGVSDAEEATNGTNPLNADTDGDGVNDKDDFYPNDSTKSEAPTTFEAQNDLIIKTIIEETSVDVLNNDTLITGSTPTVLIKSYSIIGFLYKRLSSSHDIGIWRIENNQIIFTPYDSFIGGTISQEYRLSDNLGNIQTAVVSITFPIIVQALDDTINKTTIEEATLDVLANDTLPQGATATIHLDTWLTPTEVLTYDGTWKVINNKITFTPSENCRGGYISHKYILMDDNGHRDTAIATVIYPIQLQALDDKIEINNIEETTINVLSNDTFLSTTTPIVQVQTAGGYTNFEQDYQGNDWNVTNNQIIFTPHTGFLGGSISYRYQLSDNLGHQQTANIELSFPILLQARQDYVIKSSIEPTIIDVLTNDIITDGSTGTVILQSPDRSMQNDGTTTIVNNQIIFTPKENFLGGLVYIWYQLSDMSGHVDESVSIIDYPYLLNAKEDSITKIVIEPTTVDVLANDAITDDSTGTILLQQWNGNTYEFVTSVDESEGTWTIVNNQVLFTPNADFNGGEVYLNYQLSDDSEHTDTALINIDFSI